MTVETTEALEVLPAREGEKELFQIDGLEWRYYGHNIATSSLGVARAAALKLQELGYVLYSATCLDLGIYKLVYNLDGGQEGGIFEFVTLHYTPVNYKGDLQYEIAFRLTPDTELYSRYGEHTYIGEVGVEGHDLVKAYQYHSRDNVIVRPTLFW